MRNFDDEALGGMLACVVMRTSMAVVGFVGFISACSSSNTTTVIATGSGGNTSNNSGGNGGAKAGSNSVGQGGTFVVSGGASTAAQSGGVTAGGAPAGGASALTGGAGAGGASAQAGATATGGASAQAGTAATGGASAQAGAAAMGGASAQAGAAATGGVSAATGGANAQSGGTGTGGAKAQTGGSSSQAGGSSAQMATGGSVTGGANSTGGVAATGGATAVDLPQLVDLQRTKFLDYGKLRIGITQDVQVATLQILLTPITPTQLVVTGVTRVDASTLDATLAYYHLPIDYHLVISGKLPDGTRFTTTAVIPGLNNGSRIGFVTKQFGAGNLRSWLNAPASATTGREAGDGICQAEADAAGFKGTFVAFLSSNTVAQGRYDAGCRAFGLTGTLPNCGQTAAPVDHAPWLSVVGLPFVEGATDIVANKWLTTIPFHADGTHADTGLQPYRSLSWGGTTPALAASTYDCTGWTVETASDRGACISYPGEYLPEFDTTVGYCSYKLKLVCLQVNGTFFGPNTLHHVTGKRAFTSRGTLTGAMALAGQVGINAADLLCQTDAAGAGIANSANFHAYVSTTADDALCHVLGGSGRVSAKCGLGSLPTDSWRRLDDYPLATPAQLITVFGQYLTSPMLYASDGTRLATSREQIWIGTSPDGSVNQNCGDWALTTDSAYSGVPSSISSAWWLYTSSACTSSQRVYCFEN